jgi:hypothetical protein
MKFRVRRLPWLRSIDSKKYTQKAPVEANGLAGRAYRITTRMLFAFIVCATATVRSQLSTLRA